MKRAIKWRFGALTFFVIAALFAYMNQRIEYILDASGVSGKSTEVDLEKPVEQGGNNPKNKAKAKEKKKQDGFVPQMGPFHGGHVSVKRPRQIAIDGEPNDWELRAGQFLCLDCQLLSGKESAWVHTMYDDKGLYIFGRVRAPSGLKSAAPFNSDLKNASFIQVNLQTDQAVAINLWQNQEGKGMVQLHYYLPKLYPRTQTKTDDDLFSAEDAIHREDGVKAGAEIAGKKHQDDSGVDIECMIPWSALYRDIAQKPTDSQLLKMGLAARLGTSVIGQLQEKTNAGNKALKTLWLLDKAPLNPLPVEVRKDNRGYPMIYPVTLSSQKDRLVVNWSEPVSPQKPMNTVLPILPAPTVRVDGLADEWSLKGEVSVSENYFGRFGKLKLYAASDASNLYLFADINDPTPDAAGDMLTLRLKTDKIHTIQVNLKSLEVDGKDALKKGAQLGGKISPEYTHYSLEATIPWALLTAGKPAPKTFPVTCRLGLTPLWTIHGLTEGGVASDESLPVEQWGTALMVSGEPGPPIVRFASGKVLDLSVGDVKGLGDRYGISLRDPFATHNPVLDILPGTATVDGAIDDWDLTGGIFLCNNVRMFLESQALWVHAMYDDTNLYLLYRVSDSTPMQREKVGRNYMTDDMLEFYISAGKKTVKISQAYQTSDQKIQTFVESKAYSKNKEEVISSITSAIRKDADGKGYVQEVAIPLKWLMDAPAKAGDTASIYFLARTSPRQLLGGPEKFSCYKHVAKKPNFYGLSTFQPSGKQTPRPIRLADGTSLPVTLVDGKPVIDVSNLP